MDADSRKPLDVIILAAGKGTRLKSDLPKVLHPLFGKPLLERVLETLRPLHRDLGIGTVYVIVGHGREAVTDHLNRLTFPFPIRAVVQEPQLGTGHAVMQARPCLGENGATGREVLVLSGDAPLLRAETLEALVARHRGKQAHVTLLGAELDNPAGYGRLVIEGDRLAAIIEDKDTSEAQRMIRVVNAGIYCLDWSAVLPLFDRISSDNAQGEFYLTDLIALGSEAGLTLRHTLLDDPDEMQGVNDRADLARCHAVLNARLQAHWMAEGVTILSPGTTLIGPDVTIGRDTVIMPGTNLLGEITVGERCEIGPYATMTGTVRVANGAKVIHSVVRDSEIGEESTVGPFAQLRDRAVLSHHVRVGNFVEVKNTRIDHHTNAAHLAYLGDSVLGSEVNIGACAVTANYDAYTGLKHQTVIEDGVKVGCNSAMIAPITLKKNCSIAAGSIITHDVESWDLAIARPRQTEVRQWVTRKIQKSQPDAVAPPKPPV